MNPIGMSNHSPLVAWLLYQSFNARSVTDFFYPHISPSKEGSIPLVKPAFFTAGAIADCANPEETNILVTEKKFNKHAFGDRKSLCLDKFRSNVLSTMLTSGLNKVDFYEDENVLVSILQDAGLIGWKHDFMGAIFFASKTYTNTNPQKQKFGSSINGIIPKLVADTTITKVNMGVLNDTTNTAIDVLEKMLDAAPAELLALGKENLVFHVTDKFARNKRRNMRKQYYTDSAWRATLDGNIPDAFDGIEMLAYPIWDETLSFLGLNTTLGNDFAILAPKPIGEKTSVFHLLMNNVGDGEDSFKLFPPDRYSKEWVMEMLADVDTLYSFEDMMVVSYLTP